MCRRLLLTAITVVVLLGTRASAQPAPDSPFIEIPVNRERIISQHLYPKNIACVPASLLNTLRIGPKSFRQVLERLPGDDEKAKMLHIIEKYGKLPSEVANKPIFAEFGVEAEDIPTFMNAILKAHGAENDLVEGTYLERHKGETWHTYLRRIHGKLAHSLSAGVPVVISVRAIGAKFINDRFLWEGIAAHAIIITRVPRKLDAHQQGFAFEFIEPSAAAMREGYLYCEEIRGFQASHGAGKTFKWLENSFLHITAPSLNINTNQQQWYARTFLALTYGMGRFSDKPRERN